MDEQPTAGSVSAAATARRRSCRRLSTPRSRAAHCRNTRDPPTGAAVGRAERRVRRAWSSRAPLPRHRGRDAPTTASMSTSEQEPSPGAGTPAKPKRIVLTPDSVHLVCPGLLEIRLPRTCVTPAHRPSGIRWETRGSGSGGDSGLVAGRGLAGCHSRLYAGDALWRRRVGPLEPPGCRRCLWLAGSLFEGFFHVFQRGD